MKKEYTNDAIYEFGYKCLKLISMNYSLHCIKKLCCLHLLLIIFGGTDIPKLIYLC